MKSVKKIISATTISLLTPLLVAHADWSTGLAGAAGFNLPNASIGTIITSLINSLLALLTLFAVLAFVISGIIFMTSAGANPDMAKKAKDIVMYSIVGIVIGLSGYVIINFIDSVL